MKAKILGLLAVGLLAGPMGVNATAVINLGACADNAANTCVIGVSGFEFDGKVFDIEFVEGRFADVFPDPTAATFWGDAAAGASVAAGLAGLSWPTNDWISSLWIGAVIPTSNDGAEVYGHFANNHGGYGPITSSGGSVRPWMLLSSSSVPEPGTLALLGLGLAGLGLSRRRKA